MKHPLCLFGRHDWVTLFYRTGFPAPADEWDDVPGCTRCRVNQAPGMAYFTFTEVATLAGFDRTVNDLSRNR